MWARTKRIALILIAADLAVTAAMAAAAYLLIT